MTHQTLLLTGFEPFLDVAVNPSGEIAQRLDGVELGGGVRVAGRVLPVSFGRAPGAMGEAADAIAGPLAAVVSLGVHRGPQYRLESRAGVRYESVQPDNDGQVGLAESLAGPEWLWTPLDLAACDRWLREAGAGETLVSEDAGGYLCERVYRAGLELQGDSGRPGLFLHVPPVEASSVEEQVAVVEGFLRRLASWLGRP